jgi:glutathione S-transferase
MPNKKIPVLELNDGTKLGQSISILRFLGKEHGYYPKDPLEAHKADYLIDCYFDNFIGIALNSALPAKLLESPFSIPSNKAIPDFIEFLEPYLKDDKFLCGDKLTIADFVIGGFYVNSIDNDKIAFGKEKWSELLTKYPNFKAYGERFYEENKVYLMSREP